jgi:hypothetical protein
MSDKVIEGFEKSLAALDRFKTIVPVNLQKEIQMKVVQKAFDLKINLLSRYIESREKN